MSLHLDEVLHQEKDDTLKKKLWRNTLDVLSSDLI